MVRYGIQLNFKLSRLSNGDRAGSWRKIENDVQAINENHHTPPQSTQLVNESDRKARWFLCNIHFNGFSTGVKMRWKAVPYGFLIRTTHHHLFARLRRVDEQQVFPSSKRDFNTNKEVPRVRILKTSNLQAEQIPFETGKCCLVSEQLPKFFLSRTDRNSN